MNFKSHSKEEIQQALSRGEPVFELDTGTSGEDDVLIGGTEGECLADICAYHEVDKLPKGWTLRQIEVDEI